MHGTKTFRFKLVSEVSIAMATSLGSAISEVKIEDLNVDSLHTQLKRDFLAIDYASIRYSFNVSLVDNLQIQTASGKFIGYQLLGQQRVG